MFLIPKFGAYDHASGKNSPQFVKIEDVLIFGASLSILIRHEKPFGQQSDFQEKLSKFDKTSSKKTILLRKKEKIINTGRCGSRKILGGGARFFRIP